MNVRTSVGVDRKVVVNGYRLGRNYEQWTAMTDGSVILPLAIVQYLQNTSLHVFLFDILLQSDDHLILTSTRQHAHKNVDSSHGLFASHFTSATDILNHCTISLLT